MVAMANAIADFMQTILVVGVCGVGAVAAFALGRGLVARYLESRRG